jgi:murein DD-endopeptidase MepM/ murein hydrolase activator NlpD
MQAKVSVIVALNLGCLVAACGGPPSPIDGTGNTEEAVGAGTPYKNPLRGIHGLTSERIDQGVDYAGSGPLYSIGNGTVLEVYNSGWPGGAFIAVRLSDGPAAGEVVYEAENITPHVRVGQSVTPDTVLGTLNSGFPHLEIGWGSPKYIGESYWAQLYGAYPDNCSTSFGINFNQLLVSLGAPSGLAEASTCGGRLPSGFPSAVRRPILATRATASAPRPCSATRVIGSRGKTTRRPVRPSRTSRSPATWVVDTAPRRCSATAITGCPVRMIRTLARQGREQADVAG